jgi:hypothetical protein
VKSPAPFFRRFGGLEFKQLPKAEQRRLREKWAKEDAEIAKMSPLAQAYYRGDYNQPGI